MKKVTILQSNYIPWKGYFDLINSVDEFIIYDVMQYTKRDWRNKNFIKSPQGSLRLSIPILTSGKYYQSIYETKTVENSWSKSHWNSLLMNYSKAPFFDEVKELLEPIYLGDISDSLSVINYKLIVAICDYLGIQTKLSSSRDYDIVEGRTERLVSLCEQSGATKYLSGAAAKEYMDEDLFTKKGIEVEWMSYEGYEEYEQLWGEFIHEVSILDLLFNCGKDAKQYMKSFK